MASERIMNEPKIPATEIDELAETWKQFANSIEDDSAKHAFKSCACDLNRLAHSYRITEMNSEKPTSKGILWKLNAEEKEALLAVCGRELTNLNYLQASDDCIERKQVRQLLGEEE